jgi:hypothetical protein
MRRPSRWARECREWKLGSCTHESAQSFRSENPPLQRSSACRTRDVLVRCRVRSGAAEQRCGNGSNLGRRCRSRGATRGGASGSAVERRSSSHLITIHPRADLRSSTSPAPLPPWARAAEGTGPDGSRASSGDREGGSCHLAARAGPTARAALGALWRRRRPGPLRAPQRLHAGRPRAAALGAFPSLIRNNNNYVDFCVPSGYNRVDVKGCVYERRWRTKRALPSPPAMCFRRGS